MCVINFLFLSEQPQEMDEVMHICIKIKTCYLLSSALPTGHCKHYGVTEHRAAEGRAPHTQRKAHPVFLTVLLRQFQPHWSQTMKECLNFCMQLKPPLKASCFEGGGVYHLLKIRPRDTALAEQPRLDSPKSLAAGLENEDFYPFF